MANSDSSPFDMERVRAQIDATGEIEDAMVEAARILVESHGYTLGDLLGVLEATLDLDAGDA